jgi:hypothetical protein
MPDTNLKLGDKREAAPDKPFRVRRTGMGSNKVLFESTNEAEARKYVANNFPRAHHEAEDHDVYLEAPGGAKSVYTAGADNDGWSEYRTPREREDG